MTFDIGADMVTALTGFIIGLGGIIAGVVASRRQSVRDDASNRKDYAAVALDGFDKLIEELRAEMLRRDADSRLREERLVTEVSRLRNAVRLLTEVLRENGLPLPVELRDVT